MILNIFSQHNGRPKSNKISIHYTVTSTLSCSQICYNIQHWKLCHEIDLLILLKSTIQNVIFCTYNLLVFRSYLKFLDALYLQRFGIKLHIGLTRAIAI
jgi:hypothetical protein